MHNIQGKTICQTQGQDQPKGQVRSEEASQRSGSDREAQDQVKDNAVNKDRQGRESQ